MVMDLVTKSHQSLPAGNKVDKASDPWDAAFKPQVAVNWEMGDHRSCLHAGRIMARRQAAARPVAAQAYRRILQSWSESLDTLGPWHALVSTISSRGWRSSPIRMLTSMPIWQRWCERIRHDCWRSAKRLRWQSCWQSIGNRHVGPR